MNHQHLVNAMCHDWNNFDVDGILDQTLWVCDCDTQQIRHICKYFFFFFFSKGVWTRCRLTWTILVRTEIYQLFNNKPSIEHWMFWLGTLVDKYVNNFEPVSALCWLVWINADSLFCCLVFAQWGQSLLVKVQAIPVEVELLHGFGHERFSCPARA